MITYSTGPTAMADEDLARAVGEDLMQHYPGHPWMVGCNHEAGTVAVQLGYIDTQMGILLHIQKLLAPGGQKLAMRAGGELLERLGLPRGAATGESAVRARAHGLIQDGAVEKSRGSTI